MVLHASIEPTTIEPWAATTCPYLLIRIDGRSKLRPTAKRASRYFVSKAVRGAHFTNPTYLHAIFIHRTFRGQSTTLLSTDTVSLASNDRVKQWGARRRSRACRSSPEERGQTGGASWSASTKRTRDAVCAHLNVLGDLDGRVLGHLGVAVLLLEDLEGSSESPPRQFMALRSRSLSWIPGPLPHLVRHLPG